MNLKAIITALVLASTTAGVASAAPRVRDHREPVASYQPRPVYGYQVNYNATQVVGYNYGQDPYVEGIARGEWRTIVSDMQLTLHNDALTKLRMKGQRLQSIEFQALSGETHIAQVNVVLNDGRTITLAPNRLLDATSAPNLRLDLGAQASCGIRRIDIVGNSGPLGRVRILAA